VFDLQAPEIIVTGSEYPATYEKALAAQVVGFLQSSGMIVLGVSSQVLPMMQLPTPEILKPAVDNLGYSLFGLFIVGNIATSSLLSTGAFEIYIDDQLVHSKLQTGVMPSPQFLMSTFS